MFNAEEYSHVRFVVEAKWMREFNRKILTKVTLNEVLVLSDKFKGDWEYKQDAKTEHANHIGFLFDGKVEVV